MQRLKRRYRPDSVAWVQHGNRGRLLPWAVSIAQKQLILSLARDYQCLFHERDPTPGASAYLLRAELRSSRAASTAPAATSPTPTASRLMYCPSHACRFLAPRMCSGRTPTPTTRAITCCSPGMRTAALSCQGAFAGPEVWKMCWSAR